MKHVSLLFIVMLVFTQHVLSQSTFGLKAGLNVSNQQYKFTRAADDFKNVVNTKSLLGYQLGVFYKTKLDNKWTISSELNLSLIGARYPYTSVPPNSDSVYVTTYVNVRTGYVEVPLTVQYPIQNFYIGVGPSVAFRAFSKGQNSAYITNDKTLDVAANLLAGYKIAKKWDVNVRYSYGLLNILKHPNLDDYYHTQSSLKNRFFNLCLLYSLK